MTKKNKIGRPSKLTPKLRKQIVRLIIAGYFTDRTCDIVGINKSTNYDWMKRGKESKRRNKYKIFYNEVTQAHAISEAIALSIISKAAEIDWRASAWWLERRYPEKWGKPKIKKVKKTSMEIDYDNKVMSVNSPFTKLNENEKSAIKSVAIKKCVITKNY